MSDTSPRERPIAVIKIGGSILTNLSAYRRAAVFVRNRYHAAPEERLVVVVSAQEGTTDKLERSARKIIRDPDPSALDLLWSTGEMRSAALLKLHLQALGVSTAVLNIHEAGLRIPETVTETARHPEHVRLDPSGLHRALTDSVVAIVPGFFASDSANRIVSLGRGGSDLTAVLLAEGLQACRCELIKDVPGYFTSDPHRDPSARPIAYLTFAQALLLAADGCDLVQRGAIEVAARCGLPLMIRSLDETAPTSRISDLEAREALPDEISLPVSAT